MSLGKAKAEFVYPALSWTRSKHQLARCVTVTKDCCRVLMVGPLVSLYADDHGGVSN